MSLPAHHSPDRADRESGQNQQVDEDTDHSDWTITVIPEVVSLDRVHAARETADRARALQEEAATAWREAALALRAEGLSVADAATIMGVSRGRISQLTA